MQNLLRDWSSVRFSLLDPSQTSQGILVQVRVVPNAVGKDQALNALNLQHECRPDSNIDCMVWWGEHELVHGTQLRIAHGTGILVILNRLSHAASSGWPPAFPADADHSDDSVSLLQVHSKNIRPGFGA